MRLFNNNELNVILDGIQDTREKIKQGEATPISLAYLQDLRTLETKVKSALNMKLKHSEDDEAQYGLCDSKI